MVFESLVVELINKYLGDYVVKLDKSQLKLGLLGGNATLENLDIKENAFDDFDLPVKVRQGHISKLTLKIPWKHLYSEPVIAELDGLYVLIIPNSEMKYDPEKERSYLFETKQKELNRIEENKLKRNDPKKETETKDSFGEKLAAQIVKNLQISISNIHIRYEDTSTCPNRHFAVGITLANLSFQTCDSSGTSIIIKEDSTREFFKSVKMDSLAVYWNSNPKPFSSENRATLKAIMKNNISSSERKLTDVSFLIQPISCSAMMHVHMKPETTNFTVPRMSLDLKLEQIGFAFNRNQYCDITGFLDSMDRAWTKNRFRKYRPNVPMRSNISIWWHFPYNVILEEQVRRRRRMWSWKYIQAHRNRCRLYTDIWEQKLLDKKLSQSEQDTIKVCEEELDLLNITLCRQQAEMKIMSKPLAKRVSKLKANKKAKKMRKKLNQKTSSGGWFSGWFGKSDTETSSSLASDGSDELQKKVRSEFTQEEKAKLYQAIGYSELTTDPDIPIEYVSLKLNLELQKLKFIISDNSLKEYKLMKLVIHSMSAHVQQRSSADAISVNLIMNNMQVTGTKGPDGSVPTLVSTQAQSKLMNLLIVDFETNPLDKSANQKINIRAEPLEIIYDSDTVNHIVKFLTPPEELQLYEISTQVLASIEEVKEMTATGLRHLADRRIYTDIKVDIKPSYFILPERGKYTKDCKMLLVDLGSILIVSERTSMPGSGDTDLIFGKDGKLNYDVMKETAYDKFHIILSTIQALMIEQGDDWRKLRSQESSKNHILRPFGFEFNLKKCVITNDANLPKIFVKGCLPHLGVIISDRVLQSVLELILHIPFPQTAPPKPVPTTESILREYSGKQLGIAPKLNLTSNQVLRAINVLPDSETASLTSTIDEDDNEDEEFKDALEIMDNNVIIDKIRYIRTQSSSANHPTLKSKFKDKLDNKKAKKTIIKEKKTSKLSKIKNMIDLDALFVINTFELQVLQDIKNTLVEKNGAKEIVKLIVHEIGTTLTLKRFDMAVQAYIGSLILAVPQFVDPSTKSPVCLAQTKKHTKGQNLLFINLLIVEKTSPDFVTVHANTRHKLECQFKSIEVCLHQEALLVVLNFINSLIPVLNIVEEEKTETWSSPNKEETRKQTTLEKENEAIEDLKRQKADTSIMGLITDRIDLATEKRTVRLKAEAVSEQSDYNGYDSGKKIFIPEITMTQWAITASLQKLRVIVANEKDNNILDISIHGMRADVKTSYYTTEVSITITDMRIQDPSPLAVYKKIIWIERDESIFSMQVALFNQGTSTPGYELDLSRVDHMVNIEVGKIKIIFLYNFVLRIQTFLNSFQESLQTVANKAQEYSEAAANKITNVLEEPPSSRTKLDINVKAPVIYIPENSKSVNALMVDLGALTFKNDFAIDQSTSVVLEESKITLSNLRVSRSILLENTVKNEKGILHPINIFMDMTRNLSWNQDHTIPQISIAARMTSISVGMSQGDYNMFQLVLQSNFNEAINQVPSVPESKEEVKSRKILPKDDKSGSARTTSDESITVQFGFKMEFLDVELFKGDANPNEWASEMPPDKCLTKMKCENLSVEGSMHLNSAMEVSVRLSNINVLDTQLDSAKKINELIRNIKNDSSDFISIKFIQDKNSNSKLIVDIAGIYMCICVDYLMMLTDFFVKAQPPPIQPPKKAMVPVRGYEKNPRKYRKKPLASPVEPRLADFEIDVKVARPEILLVEDMLNPDSNAIMVQTNFVLKYSIMKESDIINVDISDFQAVFCPFRSENRKKNTMDIISPTSISLYCNKPINNGMQGSLTMEHLIINITPAVIQSISKIMNTLTAQSTDETSTRDGSFINNQDQLIVDNFWEKREFDENEFLFISKGLMEKEKINTRNDGVESGFDVAQILLDVEQRRADQKFDNGDNLDEHKESKGLNVSIYLRMPDIKVILESEVAKKCVPMLIFECSMDGDLKNPLTQICLGVTVSVSVSYFNDHINVWEPLLEVYPEEHNRQYSFEIEYISCDDSGLFDEEDFEDLISIEPSAISILLLSRDALELTVSKSALDVLSNLGKAFEDAYSLHLEQHKSIFGAPYVVKNTCGKDVVFYINKEFDLKPCNSDEEFKVYLKADGEVQLYDAVDEKQSLITEEKQAKIVKFGFADSISREYLSIYRTEVRALLFSPKDNEGPSRGNVSEREINTLIVSTTAYLGMKQLELRSVLQVFNNTDDVITLYYLRKKSDKSETAKNYLLLEEVLGGKCYNVPIPTLLTSNGKIYISVKQLNTEISNSGALWNIGKNAQPSDTQILLCKSNTGVMYYYSVALSIEEVQIVNSSETLRTYKLDINVPLALHNQLPIKISYQSQIFSHDIKPGCLELVRTACLKVQSNIKVTYHYQKKEWFGSLDLGPKMEELSVINFKAKEGYSESFMDLGVHLAIKNGQANVTIYSPYWMLNKTGYTLTYKAGDDCQVEHDAANTDAVLFSFLSKSIFSKKKETISQAIVKKSDSGYSLQSLDTVESPAEDLHDQLDQTSTASINNVNNKNQKFAKTVKAHLKINDSLWSDKFSLDTVGSSGKVMCKKKPVTYEVGVKINLSSSGLTKIVTFLPYYMILNQSSIVLYCNELVENAGWIKVPPGEAVPFWPRSEVGKSMMMRCKVEDREVLVTQPFPFYESHSILMKLEKKFVGIFVEVQITEEANLINLQLYQEGMALVKLINHLGDDVEIHFKQYNTPQELILPAYQTVMYAWQDGRQKREFIWRVEGDKKQHSNNLTSDGIEDFYINEMKAYWVSFVWDSNRILLFTNDIHVAKHARLSADLESIDQEITISLHSIGLSLVDNSLQQELAYISITSSGVKWNQIRRKNRHKPLKLAQSEALEAAFDEFVNRLKTSEAEVEEHIVKVEGLEVDLSKKLMIKPEKCELSRVFEPGVFLQYRTSPHQVHVHLRIYKIQIDNQMSDCNFPVVFAPFPPPRSVALDTGLKPLIELSAVIIKSGETGAMRYKYFRVLIQEMQLMLDQGFVNSILDFVSGSVPTYDEEAMFVKDCQMIRASLIETSTIKTILSGGKKCVFDNFHISPIKIHLSFSLSRVNRTGKTALHSEVLNLFLQSVGIAITDMQDVIFKLGYFEKQNSIMPMNQMVSSITSHYVSQALRQMYVLVLGLDVLGNPFGVIRGMAQGVEDLFYEPVRGAVLGPEEFVEGVAYGVKSLFGHAVGGAAGAVSRIVGTMGKGIAALTLDADYQRKRREQLAKRPENLGVGLAQGGKGLIVGFVQGVTGVVTKPIDGAKKDGIEGFFKGVGKGLVGVVTRPVSGVVDFASSSFEGIRRVADTNIEVFRIRPPRFIAKDGIIRSYGLREAEGNNIWIKITEKCDPIPNELYVFHVYCKSKKNVIFLTNQRIFHLDRNEILGIWSIQWQIAYEKLDGPPTINESKHTIVFTLKEKQRKLFSKDNITKEIEADLIVLKAVVSKIIKIQKYFEDKKQYSNIS